jgi:hypothetical protein
MARLKGAPFAFALLLAACSADKPAPTNTAETNSSATAAPAAMPSAAPEASAAKPLGALTPEGWGALKVGMTLAEITEAIGPDSEPNAVGGPDPASCDEFRPARAPEGMLVMVEGGRLTRISLIRNAAVKTDRGLGLGIPASAVRAAYGASLVAEPHKYVAAPAEYLTAWPGAKSQAEAKAYLDDPAARGLRYVVDATGKVTTIHAGGPSIQYVEGCA